MINSQKTFINGLDLIKADTQLDTASYLWLVNARNRFGPVEPVKKHIDLTDNAPKGLKQGITSLGDALILFVAGRAYYKKVDASNWILVPHFRLSASAPTFWYQTVPASSMNFLRKPKTSINSTIDLTTDTKIYGTPSGLVVQDGVSQPYIIFYDTVNKIITSRRLKRFGEWENVGINGANREYVPIGKQMMFLNEILFIVAPDGKSVYRSITGRPLDFMINVTTDGNRLATEALGGAATVSFAFDFDDITCLKTINLEDAFVYATAKTTRIVMCDYASTIFGEPRFREAAKIDDGVANQNCFVEKTGDYIYVNREGVRSFNAVQTYKFKGRNSLFSLQVSKLLSIDPSTRIYQDAPLCLSFNNYLLFNLQTKYGNAVVVYDTLLEKWVSFDITTLCYIKDIATIDTSTESRLYAITWDDEVYQMYADTKTETAIMRTRSWTASTPEGHSTGVDHKTAFLRTLFNAGTYEGTLTAIELVDEMESIANRTTIPLSAKIGGVKYPVIGPVGPMTECRVNDPAFSLTQGLSGNKISMILIWDNDAKLIEYELETSDTFDSSSQEQKENAYNSTYATNS